MSDSSVRRSASPLGELERRGSQDSGRVGVREVLGGDDLVGERRVERGDEVVAAAGHRVDARDAMVAVLRPAARCGTGLPSTSTASPSSGSLRDVDLVRERAVVVRVTHRVVRDAGHVLAEGLRADAVADHRVHLAAERAALGGDAVRVEVRGAARTRARDDCDERSERDESNAPADPAPSRVARYSPAAPLVQSRSSELSVFVE